MRTTLYPLTSVDQIQAIFFFNGQNKEHLTIKVHALAPTYKQP